MKLVSTSHITADGVPRAISFHEATPGNPKEYFVTKMPDGRKIKAKTYDGLIEKLFIYYTAGPKEDCSLKTIFKAALKEKEVSENPSQLSVIRYRDEFDRFFSKEMAGKDIREITEIDLKMYTQEWVNREHPKKSVFFAYKGILNQIFTYAFKHRIISE
ncbi:MAG: hypothetical protein K6G45_12945, partial [Lachnospiraceae bacterium]|nr:hypothetical protein [Lachnospiraceae bacterium]